MAKKKVSPKKTVKKSPAKAATVKKSAVSAAKKAKSPKASKKPMKQAGAKAKVAKPTKAAGKKATSKIARGAKAPSAKPGKVSKKTEIAAIKTPQAKAPKTAKTAKPIPEAKLNGKRGIGAPGQKVGAETSTEPAGLEEDVFGSDDEPEEVILTDAEGRRYCRVPDCDQISQVEGYCRFHYLLFWKKIQVRKRILSEGKLERYIEELTARYPDKYLEMLRKDLRSEKDFLAAIQELELDDGSDDGDFEDETQNFIEEMRGVSPEGGREEDDY